MKTQPSTSAGSPLLERERELASFDELIAETRAGRGRTLSIEGPPGVGKTTLIAAFRARAEGFHTAEARASELECELSFGVARQLFNPLLRSIGNDESERVLRGAAGLARPALGLEGDTHTALGAASRGMYWLMAELAERAPLLLAIDDAHWADEATMRWLCFAARHIGDLPVLIVMARRPREHGTAPTPLDSLADDPLVAVVRPEALTATAVGELVADALGQPAAPEFTLRCLDATGGNALLLRELLRTLSADGVAPVAASAALVEEIGPRTVGASVLARLERLPAEAAELAKAAAVLGRDGELRQAAELAGLDSTGAARAADALAAADILLPSRPLAFVHPIVRAAVYAELAPAARAARHGIAARRLHADGAPLEIVAGHLVRSEPANDPWVVATLVVAGAAEIARGAPEAAVTFLSRALREPPRPEERGALLRDLGAAELLSGHPGARGHLRSAVDALESPRACAEAAQLLGRALFRDGRIGEAVAVLDAAIEALGPGDREMALALDADLIGAARLSLDTRVLALERLARHSGEIGDSPSPAERRLLANMAAEALPSTRPAEEASRLAERALDGGRLLEEEGGDSPVFQYAVGALAQGDRFDMALEALADALADARRRGDAVAFTRSLAVRAELNYRLGRVGDAVADAQQGIDALDERTASVDGPLLLAALCHAMIERDEAEDAAEELRRACLLDASHVETYFDNILAFARGRVRLAQGRTEAGVEELLACGARQEAWGALNPAMIPWRSTVAPALAQLGRLDEARRHAAEELARARSVGAPRALGIALRAVGLVSERECSISALEEAVATLAPSQCDLELARALTDLGAVLNHAGRRVDARERLTLALDRAHSCGAHGLAARAHAELLAAGSRPRRLALEGPDSLTPSERRVAELAAQGLSNREVAQVSFVAVKTVEMHLGRAYRKLGISSRADLPRALARTAPAAAE